MVKGITKYKNNSLIQINKYSYSTLVVQLIKSVLDKHSTALFFYTECLEILYKYVLKIKKFKHNKY